MHAFSKLHLNYTAESRRNMRAILQVHKFTDLFVHLAHHLVGRVNDNNQSQLAILTEIWSTSDEICEFIHIRDVFDLDCMSLTGVKTISHFCFFSLYIIPHFFRTWQRSFTLQRNILTKSHYVIIYVASGIMTTCGL